MRALIGMCLVAAVLAADSNAAGQARRISTDYRCGAELGAGVGNPRRRFCDVFITPTPAESVIVPVPSRTGSATLLFDLHNRFTVIGAPAEPGEVFERQTAIVAILAPGGAVLQQAAVRREFRSLQDLFDRITGGTAAGGVKFVAPGQPQAVKAAIPPGLAEVGIIGQRQEILNRAGATMYDTPGRPIAIVSNVRVEYIAR